MIKQQIPILLVILSATLMTGCSDEHQVAHSNSGILIKDGRLVFPDETTFTNTMAEISRDERVVKNNRYQGLPYKSFASTLSGKSNEQLDEAFTLQAHRIIANENKEFQVGRQIYRLEGNSLKILSETGHLENEISPVVEIVSKNGQPISGSREINVWYSEALKPLVITDQIPDQIRYRLLRVITFNKYTFYLQMEAHPDFSPTLMNVERFAFWGSVCDPCHLPPLGPLDKYNASTAEWQLGYMSWGEYQTYGLLLHATFRVKGYDRPLSDLYIIEN